VLAAALGNTGANVDILSYRPWILSRKVAKSYRAGRVFLSVLDLKSGVMILTTVYRAGDAAHAFPPTGGLGLNSGLGDVHNLAYKLAAVLQGNASDSLLDTYETDRRPVAMVNSIQSVKNGQKIFNLLKTLGLGDDVERARANLYKSIHDPKIKTSIDEQVEGQREHFDNVSERSSTSSRANTICLQLELHIGYVYDSPAIPPHASHYRPKFEVGARIPHTWIKIKTPGLPPVDVSYIDEFSEADIKARKYSTLDLCEFDKFVLIGNLDVPGVKTVRLGVDYEVVGDDGKDWVQKAGVASGGGLLVRPDQHILHVLKPGTTMEDIQKVVAEHLGITSK
jgi:hypothetical protein